ncbi:hypothetical protein H6P81_001216 [Aristolochia fimbriata]|uniref:SBP-type domain-containing protein n=1 Tax=Aristolochia fimbriata TaxID=158543 RepID=A0AAV7FAV2_ARIFI|nr:hypothetical protein H6P81_001216 [Aristolochia fimbriata]
MGRGRGKGKKLTVVASHEDPGSGGEDTLPAYKRRGRPQKPLKDEPDEEDVEKIEEEDGEHTKPIVASKEMKVPAAVTENGKKRKKYSQVKENVDTVKEENELDILKCVVSIDLLQVVILISGLQFGDLIYTITRKLNLMGGRRGLKCDSLCHVRARKSGRHRTNMFASYLDSMKDVSVFGVALEVAGFAAERETTTRMRLNQEAEMEMGSSALGSNSGSSDSLNGLKFGKKIYFEDVGSVESSSTSALPPAETKATTAAGVAAAAAAAAPPRRGRGLVQGNHTPRCQVEGCKVDLTGAKAYYCRHKVCAMHSKSPKVIVAGLEQRFCQQCSRFHQLAEFDQGKRSCRRRLAGHNERRRKPPPGSLLSSRYGRLASSFNEDTGRVGGFLNFSSPRLPGRDVWPTIRSSEQVSTSQVPPTGKYLPHLWQGSFQESNNIVTNVTHPYLQGSSAGTVFPSQEIPASECLTGVSDSSCALSLLSNQPWENRGRPSGLTNLVRDNIPSLGQSILHSTAANNITGNNASWGFKSGASSSSQAHEVPHDLALTQIQGSISNQFPCDTELSHQASRQYTDIGQSRAYGSTTSQINWTL